MQYRRRHTHTRNRCANRQVMIGTTVWIVLCCKTTMVVPQVRSYYDPEGSHYYQNLLPAPKSNVLAAKMLSPQLYYLHTAPSQTPILTRKKTLMSTMMTWLWWVVVITGRHVPCQVRVGTVWVEATVQLETMGKVAVRVTSKWKGTKMIRWFYLNF